VRAALAAGADCNAADRFGHTPLILAAAKGSADCCAALLEAGAERGARNAMGQNAAEAAQQRGHAALAAKLAVG
jgi:ankyrin repeat protein